MSYFNSPQNITNSYSYQIIWSKKRTNHNKKEIAITIERTVFAVKSYLFQWENEFSKTHDYFHLRGQDNHLHYLPQGRVSIRVHADDRLFEVLARIAACRITGCLPVVSVPPGLSNSITEFLAGHLGKQFFKNGLVIEQDDDALCDMISKIDRIRYAHPNRVPNIVFEKAGETGFYISRQPVYMEGRIELLQYLKEQSVCNNYHRYGNLGERYAI